MSKIERFMYTTEEREQTREDLVAMARADRRISGAALTGSAAVGASDEWSDIDLAFGVADPVHLLDVIKDWTELMYRDHGALHHMDVVLGAAVYRVFLLTSTLQVDLAFFPAAEFGATHPTFRLLFGAAVERPHMPPPSAASLINWGWLYALHARSCIERGRRWQAEYMISGIRDHTLALAAVRHDLPAEQGRGTDRLPVDVTAPLEGALVRRLDASELRRAFRVATECLLAEIDHADPALGERLRAPLTELGAVRQVADHANRMEQ
jgi:predicted nucleotidyltransferase